MKEEDHYTIKRVSELPKRGNLNFIYILKQTNNRPEKWFVWELRGRYQEIIIGGDNVSIDTETHQEVIGNGVDTEFIITHNFGDKYISSLIVVKNSTDEVEEVIVELIDENNLRVVFSDFDIPTTNAYTIKIRK